MDTTGNASDGWESSPNFTDFSVYRTFSSSHRIRRRRWFRKWAVTDSNGYVSGVNSFYHSAQQATRITKEAQLEKAGIRVGIQVDGGKWSLTNNLPPEGSVHGVIRVAKARWPRSLLPLQDDKNGTPLTSIYELCYALKPLDGPWGLFSRSMIVTSRFLLRNDSTKFSFEVKQSGSSDSTKIEILPGTTKAFHWSDCRIPELISVRPCFKYQGRSEYKWSGGFDPVNIGPVPLRIRKNRAAATSTFCEEQRIRSIKLEADIRPRTGGTGITLSFIEEDEKGVVSLFRIENLSPFPLWYIQDGILSNPSLEREIAERDGDILRPNDRTVFALDVPFRQGKYSHRRAATMNDLLRIRISLAPLSSRDGVVTMKPISLNNVGERIRLNPSKLDMLTSDLKASLEHIRIVGSIHNDGPTRVLFLW
jgi:SHR-binding domain of vacuolar-sorting associated protein 13